MQASSENGFHTKQIYLPTLHFLRPISYPYCTVIATLFSTLLDFLVQVFWKNLYPFLVKLHLLSFKTFNRYLLFMVITIHQQWFNLNFNLHVNPCTNSGIQFPFWNWKKNFFFSFKSLFENWNTKKSFFVFQLYFHFKILN